MAPAPTTSSPRDHVADANPDLARKKLRLGDEEQSTSPDGSVVIEALEPEDIGTNIHNAIEIDDDLSVVMAPYSDDFIILPRDRLSPYEQLGRLQDLLAQNAYLNPELLVRLSGCIDQHIAKTAEDSHEWRQHYLEDDADFFERLAIVAVALFDTGELFEPGVNCDVPTIRLAFEALLTGLEALSRRIVPFLPGALKSALSRRDSAQGSARQQALSCLYYIVVAEKVLSLETQTYLYFSQYDKRNKLDNTIPLNQRRFFEGSVVADLAAVVRTLSGGMREMKGAWLVMENALKLLELPISQPDLLPSYPDYELKDVMETINSSILPAICEKHPRALPEGFHGYVVNFGTRALYSNVKANDLTSAISLYERFVKSETDAVLPYASGDGSATTSLLQLCNNNSTTLARLLSTSWAMQAGNGFIRSDIMDVRNVGIISLRDRLLNLFNAEKNRPMGMEHPVVQYAVRFLRSNEITAYIFGPESRAGLVRHSANIICFLAATSTYTNAETDIVWQACSTSVEADFVKASFLVLGNIKQFLDFPHLIYIARKYATTPLERLDPDAFEFLDLLFKDLEGKLCMSSDAFSDHLELVFTSIEILKATNAVEYAPLKDQLRQLCVNVISGFARSRVPFEKKREVYKHCMPEIQQKSKHATTAVEVLNLCLDAPLDVAEADYVLAMLPVSAAVDELCAFVHRMKSEALAYPNLSGSITRLTCITRLMTLASDGPEEVTKDRLFDYVFGDSALSNESRNEAWGKLYELSRMKGSSQAANSLWQDYMHKHVPSLRADLATPKLIDYISNSLRAHFRSENAQSDLTHVLDLALWNVLVRFATTSTSHVVVNTAGGATLDLLFHYSCIAHIPPAVAVSFQTDFARRHVESLCRTYQEFIQAKEAGDPRMFVQGMNLLDALLNRSRETASTYTLANQSPDLTLGEFDKGEDKISFTAQICGPKVQPDTVNVHARRDTKVSELIDKLPQRTGAAANRVIAGGKEVSLDPDLTLGDVGIEQAGVLMIRPKYTFDLNIDSVLTCSGPIEQEIMAQYESLESFLDGPELIANKVYSFLCNVRQSSRTRARVSSTSSLPADLFPVERPWRCAFSLKVLRQHLHDFAHLGVTDDNFIDRSVRLLMLVILDETRPFQPMIVYEIATTLLKFLEERDQDEECTAILDQGPRFVSRMITLISEGHALPLEPNPFPNTLPVRTSVVITIYKALLTACRTVKGLWHTFSQDQNVVELHRILLLDRDRGVPPRVAQHIKSLCQDKTIATDLPGLFWNTIIPNLSEALTNSVASEVYFHLAVDVLNANFVMRTDETSIRSLIEVLTLKLWTYYHNESTWLPVTDKAMAGLVQLLTVAVTILKSFKKPLQLDGLASQLLRRFLFPTVVDADRQPLITEPTRDRVYDLVRCSFELDVDYNDAIDLICKATRESPLNFDFAYTGHQDWFRPPWHPAGLTNLGMTCYMNSLLQQLFANLQFRQFILHQPVLESQQQNVLAEVQALFARMQDGTPIYADTCALAQSLNVQVGNQEDVHTFYTTLFSRLEDNIQDRETKLALTNFFTGKSVTQVKGECGHVSSRTEPFTELSVTVKNKGSLLESLDEFVQGEPLEGANKYKCMTCEADDGGRLVNAVRRTCLDEVPDNLTFCLKRFTYEAMIEGENKVNDRFEFPSTIDMSLYKRNHLENPDASRVSDVFELVGVIVHQGSLQYGHYWSYVRIPDSSNVENSAWVCLEDSRFLRCMGGVQEVQEQCFGGSKGLKGSERSDNAYVLFYQRKSYIADAHYIDLVPEHLRSQFQLLPRVSLPTALAADIEQDNKRRQHIQCLFEGHFSSFIIWLLDKSPSMLEARTPEPTESEISGSSESSDRLADGELEMNLGVLIANYAMRILLADSFAEARLDAFMTSLTTLVEANTMIAGHILRQFCATEGFGFAYVVRNESPKVRSRVLEGLWKCLSHLREKAPAVYAEVWPMVLSSHACVVGPCLDAATGKWDEYFDFAAKTARHGFDETGFVLQQDYLMWLFDVLYLRLDPDARKNHVSLSNWMKLNEPDLSGLFTFLFNLLSGYMDLSEDLEDVSAPPGQRRCTNSGWCLRQVEIEQLSKTKIIGRHRVSLLFLAAARYCTPPTQWQDYPPGKLLGLLVSEKANFQLVRFAEDSLIRQFDFEERNLVPLLNIALHYCLNRPDQDCKTVMVPSSRQLHLWDGSEREVLAFFEQAFNYAPAAVVDTMVEWAPPYLKRKKLTREQTAAFLSDTLLGSSPLSDDPALDAGRIRTTRSILAQLITALTNAYNNEESRLRYDSMIDVLERGATYLKALQEEVSRQRQRGERLRPEIQAESDEARALLVRLEAFLEGIQHWEVVVALPTRPLGIQRSVEGESDDSDTSYADLESDEGA